MPKLLSACSSTTSDFAGAVKLGQPQCESNLASDVKSSCPHAAQTYLPSSLVSVYSPVNGRSVPFWRRIWYCSGVSSRFHSCSVLRIFSGIRIRYANPKSGADVVWSLGDEQRGVFRKIAFATEPVFHVMFQPIQRHASTDFEDPVRDGQCVVKYRIVSEIAHGEVVEPL